LIPVFGLQLKKWVAKIMGFSERTRSGELQFLWGSFVGGVENQWFLWWFYWGAKEIQESNGAE
jgi:hypothetical protein